MPAIIAADAMPRHFFICREYSMPCCRARFFAIIATPPRQLRHAAMPDSCCRHFRLPP